jgi:aryl-alcohol dehydrogenase-like predicted oxidoreductase
MLKKRKLGKQGLEVSEIGLGCMGMSQSYGSPNEAESLATIHRALDLGVDFFDTAEVYGPYTNESLLGKALQGRRDKVVIATKFGFKIASGKMEGVDSRPEHIIEVVESSLKRLGTDYIDLLYQHRVDPKVPIEEVIGTMAKLVKAGKVRYLGLSEAGEETITRAHKTHPISALQSEYSLWERNLEPKILPLLRKLGIGLVPFAPLGRGFLAGTAKRAEEYPESDFRRGDPRYQGKNFDANMKIVALVQSLAKAKKATPAQVALAWLLLQGEHIVPIPGTKRRSFLEENLGAAQLELTTEDLADLDLTKVAAGPRYNPMHMSFVDR